MAGFFISFEGIDKSGKSTQAARLVRYLQEAGREVVFTHEPGGTELGQELRHLALNWKPQNSQSGVDPTAEIFLFAADRAQHVAEIIQPALEEGKIVVTDRYVDSTLAYQVYGKKINKNFIQNIHKYILDGVKPNLTFVLKVSPKASRKRLIKRKTTNRYDNFAQSFYTKAQKSFLKIAKNRKNYFILDSSVNDSSLEKKIFRIVCKYLKITILLRI